MTWRVLTFAYEVSYLIFAFNNPIWKRNILSWYDVSRRRPPVVRISKRVQLIQIHQH